MFARSTSSQSLRWKHPHSVSAESYKVALVGHDHMQRCYQKALTVNAEVHAYFVIWMKFSLNGGSASCTHVEAADW